MYAKKDCGFWCSFGKVLVVASADIVGAGAVSAGTGYAVVTGAAASQVNQEQLEERKLDENEDLGLEKRKMQKRFKTFGRKMITKNLNYKISLSF